MNTWKVILATLVIFGAGVVAGGLLVGYSDRAWRQAARRPAAAEAMRALPSIATNDSPARENRLPSPLNAPLRKEFMERLNRELNLTPEQNRQIEQIITEGQDRNREVWRAQLAETRQRIRGELTPEQQTRFEELIRQRPRDQRRPSPDRPAATVSPPTVPSTPAN